jgi:hypothetical protein
MTPAQFNEGTRQHGLYHKSVGLVAAQSLAALIQEPTLVLTQKSWRDRSKKPSSLAHMGALIRAGLARRVGDHYRATDAGREWLGKLIEAKLFPNTTN